MPARRPTLKALLTPLAPAVLALAGCNTEEPAAPAPAAWLLTEAPADAASVAAIKADAAEGDTVVLRGRIGGRLEPITAESPVFVVMDLAIPYCGQHNNHDGCPTPWDYCCVTPESKTANSATVQLVAADGAPLDADPVAAGLAELDEVVVIGTVGPRPTPDVLTIRATGVHRVGG